MSGLFVGIVPSGFPQMFTDRVESSQSISFNWIAPTVEEQNGVIISYTVNVLDAASGQNIGPTTVPSSQTSITVAALLPFTTYLCSIAASTSLGMGPFSTSLMVTTLQDSKMSNLSIQFCTINTILIMAV